MNAIKRLESEHKQLMESRLYGCSAGPSKDDIFIWNCIVMNTNSKSPYHNGIYKLIMKFNNDYPFKPPIIKCKTNIFHPNIKNTEICLDILRDGWSPALNIEKVLISIASLLDDPNPNDPLNQEVATAYLNNYPLFFETAKTYNEKYAN